MVITDHRVHNVLRTYSKQLQRKKLDQKLEENQEQTESREKTYISDEARRRMIVDDATSRAFDQARLKDE